MRYVTITLQCDWNDCDTTGEEGGDIVAPTTLSLDGKKPRQPLLCKAHRADLEAVLLPLLERGVLLNKPARPTGAPKKAGPAAADVSDGAVGDGGNGSGTSTDVPSSKPRSASSASSKPDLVCREIACGRPFKGNAGMAQHVVKAHGFASLDDYRAEMKAREVSTT